MSIYAYPGLAAGGGAPVGGGAYSDVEDWAFDWTAQSDFDFIAAGDGTYPIGGYNWRVLNTALASLFRVEAGAGVRCQLQNGPTNVSINELGMQAPGLYGILGELMQTVDVPLPGGGTLQTLNARDPISVWWHLQKVTPVRDAHVTCCLRQNGGGAAQYSSNLQGGGPYRDAGGENGFVVFSNNRQITAVYADPMTAAQDAVWVVRIVSSLRAQIYVGLWEDGDWPTWDRMLLVGFTQWNDQVEPVDLVRVPPSTWVATSTGVLALPGQTEFLLQHQRITRG